jgi:hypothetical protein
MKFHYLTTPLLAPDLVYFLNRDLIDVATRYPPIMFSLIAAAILIPGLLYLVWRMDRPQFLHHVSVPRRHWIRAVGVLAAAFLLVAIDSPAGPFPDVFVKGMWQTMNDKSYVTDFFTSFYQTEIRFHLSQPMRPHYRGRNPTATIRRPARLASAAVPAV